MARRSYQQHGLYAMKGRLKLGGLAAIDKRCGAGRALAEWRRELVADLGGAAALSAQQRAVIETASQLKLLLDSVGAWLLAQPTLVNGRRRAVYPVVGQWQQLADALLRHLSALGLERRERPAPSLHDYLTERYGRTGTGSEGQEDRDALAMAAGGAADAAQETPAGDPDRPAGPDPTETAISPLARGGIVPMRCARPGCLGHAQERTEEVACARCGKPRWVLVPGAAPAPTDCTCQRCLAVLDERGGPAGGGDRRATREPDPSP